MNAYVSYEDDGSVQEEVVVRVDTARSLGGPGA